MLSYLVAPFSHPDPAIQEARRVAVCRKAAEFIKHGINVLSPIAHNTAIAKESDINLGWEFWKTLDTELLIVCDQLIVFKLEGWEQSVGVQAEIGIATKCGIPIIYIDETTDISLLEK